MIRKTARIAPLLIIIVLALIVFDPFVEEAQSQIVHGEQLRSSDTPTSPELLLDSMSEIDFTDGWIDFAMLETTVLKRNPPPIFVDGLAALDGEPIKMVAFMTPFDSLNDMTTFMAFPFPTGCFFCAPPSPLQVALVRQVNEKGRDMPFINEPIYIEGTLSLWKEDSKDLQHQSFLYVINDAKVRGLTQKAVREMAKERRAGVAAKAGKAPLGPPK